MDNYCTNCRSSVDVLTRTGEGWAHQCRCGQTRNPVSAEMGADLDKTIEQAAGKPTRRGDPFSLRDSR